MLAVIVFGGAAIAKSVFSAGQTPDGDTVRNRLEGRGRTHQPLDRPGRGEGEPGNGWAEDG